MTSENSPKQRQSEGTDTGVHQTGEMTQEMPVIRAEQIKVQEAALVLLGHPDAAEVGKHWHLKPEDGSLAEIGRLSSCSVYIGNASAVSRQHARIRLEDGRYRLYDLKSTNGTYLNGERLQKPHWLSSGDRIQVGTVHLKFIIEADVEAAYHEMMYTLAVTDPLTGVANRRRFEEEKQREFARAERRQRTLGLLIVDVDQFKGINDRYGHPIADEVLKGIADSLTTVNRGEQTVARIGGDEFAVLIPEATKEDLDLIAQRIREQVAGVSVHSPRGEVTATCSIGGAVIDAREGTGQDLYAAADAALYESKRGGRNRATIHAAS